MLCFLNVIKYRNFKRILLNLSNKLFCALKSLDLMSSKLVLTLLHTLWVVQLSEGKETELQNKNTAVPELVKKVKKKTKTVKAAPAPIPVKRVTIVEEKPKKKKPAANQPKVRL